MNFAKQIIASRYGWTPEYATAVVREWGRFMELAAIDNKKVSPCADVDALWHQLLLDPRFYYDYCMKNHGKIIEHYPQNAVVGADARRQKRLEYTLALYREIFGVNAPASVWSRGEVVAAASLAPEPSLWHRVVAATTSKQTDANAPRMYC